MSDQWYLLVGDREYGPFTSQQLSEFVQQGRLIRENFVRTATSPQWVPASQIPGLFPAAPPPQAAQEMPLARPALPPGIGGAPVAPAPAAPRQQEVPLAGVFRPPVPTMSPAPMAPVAAPAPAVPRQEVPLAGVFRPPVPASVPAPVAPVAAPAPAVPRQEVPLAGAYRPPTPAVPAPRPAPPVASGPSAPMPPTVPTATGAAISSRMPQAYSPAAPQIPTQPAVPLTPTMAAPAPAIHTPGAWSPPARVQNPVTPGPQAMSVPTAMPVAQGLAVPQGYPQSLPVGVPAGTPPLGTIPVTPTAGPALSGSQFTERTELARKRAKANSQQLMMIFGGVGAGVAILLLIVVVAIVKGTRKTQEQPAATTVKKPKPKAKTDGQAPHGHDAGTGTVNGPPLPAPVINTWLNAAKDRVGLKGVLRMYVSSAWFENSGQQRRVKVAVRLTNSAGKGLLDYHPWPAHVLPSDPFTAVMTDDRGTRLTPVASGMTARTVHQLKPGQVVTEQLAFDMPPYEVTRLRLALPMAAFGHSGHIGFEIPRAMIQAQEPVPTLDIGFDRPSPLPNVTDTTPVNDLDASILGVREVHTTPLRTSDLPVGLPKSKAGEVQKDKDDLQNQLDQAKPVEPLMEKPLEKEKEQDKDQEKKPADSAPAEK